MRTQRLAPTQSLMRTRTFVFVAVIGSTLAMILPAVFSPEAVGERLMRDSVRVSLFWYVVAVTLMLLSRTSWKPSSMTARVCWTLAAVIFVVHVGFAFHFRHHWSHESAFAAVREASGSGNGVFVSYFFTILWAADAIYWWFAPSVYASRPVGMTAAFHAFMALIIFNGVVVFETGVIRWVGIVVFSGLTLLIFIVNPFAKRATIGPA